METGIPREREEPACEQGKLPGAAGQAMFTARPGGYAEALGGRLAGLPPTLVATILWGLAFLVLAGVIVGLGLLLKDVLLPAGMIRFDLTDSRWFAARRTGAMNTLTGIGSYLGSTAVILVVAAVAVLGLAIRKHWRQIGFLAYALTLEFGVFLIATLLVGRARPPVARLDQSPPTSSYPSGHTGTSIALYVGLTLVIWSLVRARTVRALAITLAVVVPIFVGLSRMYRGMHFPTDVAAGVLLGGGAVLLALLATRSVQAAYAERCRRRPAAPSIGSQDGSS